MNTQTTVSNPSEFFRFQVIQGHANSEGKIEKLKSVGMAYLKAGQSTYTLRLWTMLNDRFYMIPNRNDAGKYLVMTREPNKNPSAKNKYFWNIVGNGVANSKQGYIRVDFNLFEKPLYVSIFPESSAHSVSLPEPVGIDEAA